MSTAIGAAALAAAIALSTPPVFSRVLGYFLADRRSRRVPEERRGQSIALVAWIVALYAVAFLLLS